MLHYITLSRDIASRARYASPRLAISLTNPYYIIQPTVFNAIDYFKTFLYKSLIMMLCRGETSVVRDGGWDRDLLYSLDRFPASRFIPLLMNSKRVVYPSAIPSVQPLTGYCKHTLQETRSQIHVTWAPFTQPKFASITPHIPAAHHSIPSITNQRNRNATSCRFTSFLSLIKNKSSERVTWILNAYATLRVWYPTNLCGPLLLGCLTYFNPIQSSSIQGKRDE